MGKFGNLKGGKVRHFLTLNDFSKDEIIEILNLGLSALDLGLE